MRNIHGYGAISKGHKRRKSERRAHSASSAILLYAPGLRSASSAAPSSADQIPLHDGAVPNGSWWLRPEQTLRHIPAPQSSLAVPTPIYICVWQRPLGWPECMEMKLTNYTCMARGEIHEMLWNGITMENRGRESWYESMIDLFMEWTRFFMFMFMMHFGVFTPVNSRFSETFALRLLVVNRYSSPSFLLSSFFIHWASFSGFILSLFLLLLLLLLPILRLLFYGSVLAGGTVEVPNVEWNEVKCT